MKLPWGFFEIHYISHDLIVCFFLFDEKESPLIAGIISNAM